MTLISWDEFASSGPTWTSKTVLIFYSSIVDGRLWCPDCRDVEDVVKQAFEAKADRTGVIVYVGDRATWRDPKNTYRQEWQVSNIPTVIRVDEEGKEKERLVESEITESSLARLLGA